MINNLRLITNDRLIDWEKIDNLPENTKLEILKKQYKFKAWENISIDDSDQENPIIKAFPWSNFSYLWVINKPKINWVELVWDRILTKDDVSLSNVDNTRDSEKPVSIPQQKAIDAINSLQLRNVTPDLPEATLENYSQIATDYIQTHFNRLPKSRDWLWIKMLDNKWVTSQVMYIEDVNNLWIGTWLYSWEITTPDLTNYYTKIELDAKEENYIKTTWNYNISWNKNFVWEVTKNSLSLINSSDIKTISYVNSLPSSPDSNTLYLLTE